VGPSGEWRTGSYTFMLFLRAREHFKWKSRTRGVLKENRNRTSRQVYGARGMVRQRDPEVRLRRRERGARIRIGADGTARGYRSCLAAIFLATSSKHRANAITIQNGRV
jgi:hypothetical protein